ncbi:MAG: type II secretion system secretin GspD [Thermodesulfobacteriota bacterium]
MKINSQVKFFFSFFCIGVWLIAGSSTALGDPAATLGELVNKPGVSSRPGFAPPSQGKTVQQQEGAPETRQQPDAGKEESVERYVTIDFEDVDINLFIKYISELTGRNFIVDKAVRGNVTIISPTKISIEEAYKVFESVLEVQGFTTVPAGSIIKIVPSADARSKSVETGFKGDTGDVSDKIVTQLIPLKYADPDELKKLFTPLVSKNSVVIAYPATNLLIVTDVLSNINRLLQIIKEIDVEDNVSEITVIPLENAIAGEVATTLDTIFEGTTTRRTTTTRTARRRTPAQKAAAPEAGPALGQVKIIADERTNSLIIIASFYDTQKVKSLAAILDKEIPRGSGNINVYYLQHANAEELSTVLTALPEKADQAVEKGKAPTISKEVQIVADKATNSLVITANKADYAVLEEVIRKLDIPRRMVYLEALIMEVNATKDFSVGVEWVAAGKYSFFGDDEGIIGGAFRKETSNLPDITDPSLPQPEGFSMGLFSEPIMINGVPFPSLGAIFTAFKSDEDVHIISTPQILTTDNEEAEIKVGENVPYITSQNTTTANQDYTNYEYKDVGVTLKITPQINQENVVRLEVFVEVIKISGGELERPTTFKRTAQTTVIIQDKTTLVLGGIIGDDVTDNVNKIPLLGDIPVLGWLFKNESQTVNRVNLYIFLTPRIIRNPTEARAVTEEKRDHADYHHETGWEGETFKYKENTREVLKSRHIPSTVKEEEQKEEEHKEPIQIK